MSHPPNCPHGPRARGPAGCPRCDRDEALAKLRAAEERAEAAEDLVEQWQGATGLIGSSGDPGDVTPDDALCHWEGVEERAEALRAAVKRASTALRRPVSPRAWVADHLDDALRRDDERRGS